MNYKNGIGYTNAYEFSKIITKYKKDNPDYYWLNEISQKSIKESIIDADKAYNRFFNKKSSFPKFKSKRNPVRSYYLYPVNGKYKHNKIKLPLLGWMRICENSYVFHSNIINARMIKDHDKYFIQMSTEIIPHDREVLSGPIGIDVGVRKFLTISTIYGWHQIDSFKDDPYIKKLNDKIKHLNQIVSNKVEINYYRKINKYMDENFGEEPDKDTKNNYRKESYETCAIKKVRKKIQRLYKKISDYKTNKINGWIIDLVKTKPEYIAIEDLSIKSMISKSNPNHITSLSRNIQDSKFYYFRLHLENKCKEYSVCVHLANRYFASSKICSRCGTKHKNLTLSDATYHCNKCGLTIDRDANAAINLRKNMKKKFYSIK